MEERGFSIKAHLLLIFVIAILAPILVHVIGANVMLSAYEKRHEVKQIKTLEQEVNSIKEIVEQNISKIGSYDDIKALISNYLRLPSSRVIILNKAEEIMFDSKSKEKDNNVYGLISIASGKYRMSVNIVSLSKNIINDQASRNLKKSNFYLKFYRDIKTSSENLLLYYIFDFKDIDKRINEKALVSYEAILISMILSVIFVLFYLYITVHKRLMKPLTELSRAASEIASGNFMQDISYNYPDEMGKLINSFTIMKNNLYQSYSKLIQQNEDRKILMGNIAHDLRTPVTVVKSYTEGLIDDIPKTEDDKQLYYETLNKNVLYLENLIGDLFMFSKIEIGQLKVDRKPVSISDIQDEFLNLGLPINVTFKMEEAVRSMQFCIDKAAIVRVLRNIIYNSYKFSANNVEVGIKVLHQNLQVSVCDNGIGIKENVIDRVFDKFYTNVPEGARKAGGSGMGLSICKEIVSLHGGKISILNNKKQGVTVKIIIPIKRDVNEEN